MSFPYDDGDIEFEQGLKDDFGLTPNSDKFLITSVKGLDMTFDEDDNTVDLSQIKVEYTDREDNKEDIEINTIGKKIAVSNLLKFLAKEPDKKLA